MAHQSLKLFQVLGGLRESSTFIFHLAVLVDVDVELLLLLDDLDLDFAKSPDFPSHRQSLILPNIEDLRYLSYSSTVLNNIQSGILMLADVLIFFIEVASL